VEDCLSVARSGGRSVGRSFRSVGRSVGHSVGRSVARSGGRSVGQSVGRLVGRSVGQSVGRSVSRSVGHGRSVDQSVSRSQVARQRPFRPQGGDSTVCPPVTSTPRSSSSRPGSCEDGRTPTIRDPPSPSAERRGEERPDPRAIRPGRPSPSPPRADGCPGAPKRWGGCSGVRAWGPENRSNCRHPFGATPRHWGAPGFGWGLRWDSIFF
jgi:hypothetical protein